jgi:hypothetical protein
MQDIRQILIEFGLGSFGAQLATQSVFFRPVTTDPDAQVTHMLVLGVQRGLGRLGYEVPLTGYLDEPTAIALRRVSGHGWPQKQWAQIFHDLKVASKIVGGGRPIPVAPASPIGDFNFTSPVTLGALAVGAFLVYRACCRR